MKIGAWLVMALLLLTGCSQGEVAVNRAGGQPARPETAENKNAPPGAVPVAGGCGLTQAYAGAQLRWAEEISAGGYGTGYAIATPPIAVAYGVEALRSGHPIQTRGRGNKVLWAVKSIQPGEAVSLDATPLGSSAPLVHYDLENLRPSGRVTGSAWLGSGLEVPTPGCWHFILRWNGHEAAMDLKYEDGGLNS